MLIFGAAMWALNRYYPVITLVPAPWNRLGWAIRLGTLSPLAGPVLFILLIQRVQILPEEHALRILFGRDYEDYCHRVKRWLGRNR
jgi:protein-S-isoprenylcysteine O-methyltransferase Ste14